jgi:hypothetical protein
MTLWQCATGSMSVMYGGIILVIYHRVYGRNVRQLIVAMYHRVRGGCLFYRFIRFFYCRGLGAQGDDYGYGFAAWL